jgi:hypothetical protein
LNGLASLLLHHHGTRSNIWTDDQSADLDFHEIAPAQLAVDRQIEQRLISQPTFPIKEKADRPYLPRLEYTFRANLSAGIPGRSALRCRVILRKSHFVSPSATNGHWKNVQSERWRGRKQTDSFWRRPSE